MWNGIPSCAFPKFFIVLASPPKKLVYSPADKKRKRNCAVKPTRVQSLVIHIVGQVPRLQLR